MVGINLNLSDLLISEIFIVDDKEKTYFSLNSTDIAKNIQLRIELQVRLLIFTDTNSFKPHLFYRLIFCLVLY